MYHLTLTCDERRAIDWVGYRAHCGDALYRLLWGESPHEPDDADWDDPRPITFHIPEHVAWRIRDNWEEEDCGWYCFGDELSAKLDRLINSIV